MSDAINELDLLAIFALTRGWSVHPNLHARSRHPDMYSKGRLRVWAEDGKYARAEVKYGLHHNHKTFDDAKDALS